MPGFQMTTSADRFSRLLGRYLEVNTRNAGDLVVKKAKDVSLQLFRTSQKLAPTTAQIKRDVKSRGWRVKRPKGKWDTLEDMQASQIGRRIKARGSVAVGWLPAVYKFGGSAGRVLAKVRNPRGKVEISGGATGSPTIAISNQMPGVAKMQAKHNILRTAFNAASKDVLKYLRNKQNETAQSAKRP